MTLSAKCYNHVQYGLVRVNTPKIACFPCPWHEACNVIVVMELHLRIPAEGTRVQELISRTSTPISDAQVRPLVTNAKVGWNEASQAEFLS